MTGAGIRRGVPAAGVAALGVVALMLRPVAPPAMAIMVLVGAAALAMPLPADGPDHRSGRGRGPALAVGIGGFALIAWLGPAWAGTLDAARWAPISAWAVTASIAAALVEEALFRRLAYGMLRPLGVAMAIGGAAVLFALVHVPLYGWATVPLNLAAGLVLGWQRSASGGWAIPAATHAAANVMAFL